MKNLILILFISLSLFSCSKERTIHITAKNAVTGAPYAGLKYEVIREHGKTWEEKYITVASGTLNENGEVFITKRLPVNDAYTIRVEEPANTCYTKNISLHFGGESNFEAPFEFAECAYLKFRYHNEACQNSDDHIEVTRYTILGDYVGFNNPAIYDGCTDYTMNEYTQVPEGKWFFKWSVTKNNQTTDYYDTIYLNPGEYKYYEFNY